VIRRIREDYIHDTSCTIVLVGAETWSRVRGLGSESHPREGARADRCAFTDATCESDD
jgi:hypothetical protein